MSSLYHYDRLYGLNPPVYIDTEGARVVQSWFTEKGIFISECQACLPRKGESHPDTGVSSSVLYLHSPSVRPTSHRPDTRGPLNPGLPQMSSLAFGYEDSFPCKPTLYNPRSLRCLYKLEGLARRGEHNHTG